MEIHGHVGCQAAYGAEDSRKLRHDDPLHLQFPGNRHDVKTCSAATGNEQVFSRVDALAYGDIFDSTDHVVVDGAPDRV